MTPQTTVIIQSLGGSSSVGRAIGLTPQAVSQWMRDGRAVPPDKVLDLLRLGIEKGIRFSPKDLRPDLDWDVLNHANF